MRSFWKSGDPFVWLAGAMLGLSLLMVVGLVSLILVNGLGFFWPRDVERFVLTDGTTVLGEVAHREPIPDPDAPSGTPVRYRIQVKRGNRDLYGSDFVWIDEAKIARRELPESVIVLERREWGNFYGIPERGAARRARRRHRAGRRLDRAGAAPRRGQSSPRRDPLDREG